jgi:hypothetical protein
VKELDMAEVKRAIEAEVSAKEPDEPRIILAN